MAMLGPLVRVQAAADRQIQHEIYRIGRDALVNAFRHSRQPRRSRVRQHRTELTDERRAIEKRALCPALKLTLRLGVKIAVSRFARELMFYLHYMIAKPLRLHFGRIEDELRDVQRHFPAINAVLNSRRDDFTDVVRQNMLAAYEFLDAVVTDELDLFSAEGLEGLLQLNHLVLLGRGYNPLEYRKHINVTRRQFFDNFRRYVKPIRRWYRRHETENPYKVASQVYIGVLSQPQLFQEGNHRTGSLIASGILLQNGRPPFVLTRQNAVAYFNPSTEIKFTDKRTINGKLRLPEYQRDFRKFLERNVNPAYVRQT